MDIRVAVDPPQAAADAAKWMAGQLRNAVRRRGSASLAVSGGSTPVLMFAALVELDVPWQRVGVWQVDERVAVGTDPARNAHQLEGLDGTGARVHLMPVTARHLATAARRYAVGLPERFDVVHLGLGDDGHTASWPPGDPVIDSHDPVAMCATFNGFERMTLTPSVVNGARHRLVLAVGEPKAPVLARWMLRDPSLPVQRVRRTGTVVVVDRAAAAQLPVDR